MNSLPWPALMLAALAPVEATRMVDVAFIGPNRAVGRPRARLSQDIAAVNRTLPTDAILTPIQRRAAHDRDKKAIKKRVENRNRPAAFVARELQIIAAVLQRVCHV